MIDLLLSVEDELLLIVKFTAAVDDCADFLIDKSACDRRYISYDCSRNTYLDERAD